MNFNETHRLISSRGMVWYLDEAHPWAVKAGRSGNIFEEPKDYSYFESIEEDPGRWVGWTLEPFVINLENE